MDTQPSVTDIQATPERVCPACGSTHRQIKAGKTGAGKPRLQCQDCKRHYVLNPQPRGLDPSLRRMAIRLYLEGNGFRRIACIWKATAFGASPVCSASTTRPW